MSDRPDPFDGVMRYTAELADAIDRTEDRPMSTTRNVDLELQLHELRAAVNEYLVEWDSPAPDFTLRNVLLNRLRALAADPTKREDR